MQKCKFGPFTLDYPERRLWRGEQEIPILAQQFDLLVMFLQNPDHLFTYEEILNLKWPEVYIDPTSMQKAVRLLARILGDRRGAQVYIQTIPRQGYRWICAVEEVDSEIEAVKQSQETNKERRMVIEPGIGWEGLVFTFGHLDSAIRAQPVGRRNGGLEEMLDRLPLPDRANILFYIARQASEKLIGPEQSVWLGLIDAEYRKIAEALDYYGSTGNRRELELAASLGVYWQFRGQWIEGRDRLQHALIRREESAYDIQAKALTWFGNFLYHLDDYSAARHSLREGAKIARQIGDDLTLAIALQTLGNIHEVAGRYQAASAIYERSLQASKQANSPWREARTYRVMGMMAQAQGEIIIAENLYRRSLAKEEQAGETKGQATCYNRLSVIAAAKHDTMAARTLLDKSRELEGDAPARHTVGLTNFNEGLIEESAGRFDAALTLFQQSYLIRLQIGEKRSTAKAMEAVARVGMKMGKEKEAAMIMGAACALRSSSSAPWSPAEKTRYEPLVADIRRKYPAAYEEGSKRVLDDVLPVV